MTRIKNAIENSEKGDKAKRDKTEAEQEMIKMISASYDISDKKYIEPILECLKK